MRNLTMNVIEVAGAAFLPLLSEQFAICLAFYRPRSQFCHESSPGGGEAGVG
jgi:hypothetical protein